MHRFFLSRYSMSVPNSTYRQNVNSSTPVSVVTPPYTFDGFGRSRVSQPFTLFDSQQRYSLDSSFTSNTLNGGSITYIASQSSANLTTTSTLNSFACRESNYVMTYQPGKSLLTFASFVMAPKATGLVQRVGYFGSDNGVYLELSDQLYFVRRSNSLGTVDSTTYKIPQSSWNIDSLNGFGPSGITLDITKAQIFYCDMEWLGVGNVRCGFVLNGKPVIAHTYQHANVGSYAYMTTGSLPVRYEIKNTASAPTSNLIQICSTVMSEGGYDQPMVLYSQPCTFSSNMTANVWYPLISLRLASGHLDAVVQIKEIDVIMTSVNTCIWSLWYNVSSSALGSPTFQNHSSSTNIQYNSNASTFTTTGCLQMASGIVTGTIQTKTPLSASLSHYFAQIGRNSFTQTSDIIVLAMLDQTGGSSRTAQAVISWNELL